MTIVPATKDEINTIFELLRACGQHMIDNGLFQWNEEYPTLQHVEEDFTKGTIHCYKIAGEIAAVISMDDHQSAEYKTIVWKYIKDRVFVVHRLAVLPKFQNRGIAGILMDFAEEYARSKSYESIRLDAYSANETALNIYRKRGYSYRGDIYFALRDLPFFCFEKKL
ncbi:GNAT family N-acetyltransferase [Crocinitomix catalasitica]|nr:GNAT family N-acetyltransferase [Crocinitomix catalasitica]